jgi:hypothetical protein
MVMGRVGTACVSRCVVCGVRSKVEVHSENVASYLKGLQRGFFLNGSGLFMLCDDTPSACVRAIRDDVPFYMAKVGDERLKSNNRSWNRGCHLGRAPARASAPLANIVAKDEQFRRDATLATRGLAIGQLGSNQQQSRSSRLSSPSKFQTENPFGIRSMERYRDERSRD